MACFPTPPTYVAATHLGSKSNRLNASFLVRPAVPKPSPHVEGGDDDGSPGDQPQAGGGETADAATLPDAAALEKFARERIDWRVGGLICDGISDPGNLGTLLRAAAMFGFRQVHESLNSNSI